ncbi:pilus assembly protein PilX [Geomonas sp. Red69]|uniref:Pilus assembly protein PilX n=1 Tax=Geomonas diazotrophica TaxID=2843197 RepID=A0ABX8JC86_9BACT|nr:MULTISPECIES: pilus assembly protein PilX [Geomonas]MBU5636140.1 pilus assembly protein PilX [Geomonas diazotrophica]QWV96038.1 pilus assembly protein PilX [Geomonas nitrogeniifigens]QXE85106.1 pilus assembly protein PilX [Geomonas nitrogeniifigens]
MQILGCERGAALITALMLTVLSLVIALSLLTLVSTGTQVSASQKRYRSSLTAAQGGLELFTGEIMPRLFQGVDAATLQGEYAVIDLHISGDDCLKQKLFLSSGAWNKCSAARSSADAASSPDLSFRLAGVPPAKGFSISTKIVDTVPGNTDRSGFDLLDAGGAVAAQDEVVRPQHVPVMYNLAVQGAREEPSAREKARLSVLYAY